MSTTTEPRRELSFDGRGINGPDEYRSRLATFTSDEAAKKYGPLFEAAPEMRSLLQRLVDAQHGEEPWEEVFEVLASLP